MLPAFLDVFAFADKVPGRELILTLARIRQLIVEAIPQELYAAVAAGIGLFIAMIGLVALIVAVVILVFFGIGYLFGRAYL